MKPELIDILRGDNVEDLYIGHISEVIATIDGVDIPFSGEALFHAHPANGGDVEVDEVRRLALYGRSPVAGDSLGVISLAGPVQIGELKPGPTGRADTLLLELNYQALSSLDSPYQAADVEFPRTELLATDLNWERGEDDESNESQVRLALEFANTRIEHRDPDLEPVIDEFTLKPVGVTCDRAGSGDKPLSFRQTNSLEECQQPANQWPCDEQQLETVVRRVPLRFVNVSSHRPDADDLEPRCQWQIGHFCGVWWKKAVLGLAVEPHIEDRSGALADFKVIDTWEKQKDLATRYNDLSPDAHKVVEVFLVDSLALDETDGGTCLDGGVASTYCILEVGKLPKPNEGTIHNWLLAHELGHVLGISHPNGQPEIIYPGPSGRPKQYRGSRDSVMDPTATPFGLDRNTLNNCRVFFTWAPKGASLKVKPLNAIVQTQKELKSCFDPDALD